MPSTIAATASSHDLTHYKLAEYAKMDVDAHSRDRGMHDRDYVVNAGAAAALLAHTPCTTHTKAALEGQAAPPALQIQPLPPPARGTRARASRTHGE